GLRRTDADQTAGRVVAFGHDLRQLAPVARQSMFRTNMAWILQDAHAALDPTQAVGEQIRQATYRSFSDCAAALAAPGMDDAAGLARRLPHQISGGQAQRVLFAVASLRQPELVVADEPTASLDDRSCAAVAARLRELRERGAALLVATHDQRLIE